MSKIWTAFSTRVRNVGGQLLTSFWARRFRPLPPPSPTAVNITDNVQRAMNLVMPLRFRGVVWRGEVVRALAGAGNELLVGLNNVGTVHFARFDIVGRNLCMFSIYDGDFTAYIRDFIACVGTAFDALMAFVDDPPPTPVALHVDEFVEWVAARDAYQLPDSSTDLSPDLVNLQRAFLVTLYEQSNVQVALYRSYPGFSAAQIRERLAIGW
jgi:hypothetical protein